MTQYEFFVVYTILIFICFCFFLISNRIKYKSDLLFALVIVVAMAWLMGNRPDTIADTIVYKRAFENCERFQFSSIVFGARYMDMETLFIAMMKLANMFGLSFKLFSFLCALVTYLTTIIGLNTIIKVYTEKDKDNYLCLLLLYMSYFGLHYGGIAVRAGLSMGIGILGCSLWISGKKIKSCVLIMIAALFQTMGLNFIVIILVWQFWKVPIKKIHLIYVLLMSIILILNLSGKISIIFSKMLSNAFWKIGISGFTGYLNTLDMQVGKSDVVVFFLFALILLLSYERKIINSKFEAIVLIGLACVFFLYPIRSINRVYDYFFLFTVPMYGGYMELHKKRLSQVTIYTLIYMMTMMVQYINCYK